MRKYLHSAFTATALFLSVMIAALGSEVFDRYFVPVSQYEDVLITLHDTRLKLEQLRNRSIRESAPPENDFECYLPPLHKTNPPGVNVAQR